MKTISLNCFVTEAQNTACNIQSLTDILFSKIDETCLYKDMPYSGCKEEMLALVDSIRLLAQHINLEGVMV